MLEIDVLRCNDFGKSPLSEAFSAGDGDVLQLLLEHRSAAQLEKETLNQPQETPAVVAPDAAPAPSAPRDHHQQQQQQQQQQQGDTGERTRQGDAPASVAAVSSTVTHELKIGDVSIKCREVALDWKGAVFTTAKNAKHDDTTGLLLLLLLLLLSLLLLLLLLL